MSNPFDNNNVPIDQRRNSMPSNWNNQNFQQQYFQQQQQNAYMNQNMNQQQNMQQPFQQQQMNNNQIFNQNNQSFQQQQQPMNNNQMFNQNNQPFQQQQPMNNNQMFNQNNQSFQQQQQQPINQFQNNNNNNNNNNNDSNDPFLQIHNATKKRSSIAVPSVEGMTRERSKTSPANPFYSSSTTQTNINSFDPLKANLPLPPQINDTLHSFDPFATPPQVRKQTKETIDQSNKSFEPNQDLFGENKDNNNNNNNNNNSNNDTNMDDDDFFLKRQSVHSGSAAKLELQQHVREMLEKSTDNDNNKEDENDNDEEDLLADSNRYEVIFNYEKQLGMLLERHDEWVAGSEKRRERVIVRMVVEHGAAAKLGVTEGSCIYALNHKVVTDYTYDQALHIIKNHERPLSIIFERETVGQASSQGYCLVREKGSFGRYQPWKRRFFILGGAVAPPNSFQLYRDKEDYERVVMSVFRSTETTVPFKVYKLDLQYRCSAMKEKKYENFTAPIKYFELKLPQTSFHPLKLGSENLNEILPLHRAIRRLTQPF